MGLEGNGKEKDRCPRDMVLEKGTQDIVDRSRFQMCPHFENLASKSDYKLL